MPFSNEMFLVEKLTEYSETKLIVENVSFCGILIKKLV